MNLKDSFLNFLLFFIKLYIFIQLYIIIGLIKATILSLIILELYNLVLLKIFGLESFTDEDMNFVAWEPEKQYNIPFVYVFEGKNAEAIKNVVIERGVKFFKRFRQKRVFTLGSFYWKEHSLEEAVKQITVFKKGDVELNSSDSILKFMEEIILNPFENEQFQWRCFISENERNQTVLVLQSDHSMYDGFGMLCLCSKLTDDFDFKKFPQMREKSKWIKLKEKLLVPFFIPQCIYYLFFTRSGKSPFKIYKNFSVHKKGVFSQKFDFPKIYKVCKSLDITFNDYAISVINAASKKYSRDKGFNDSNGVSCLIPVNLRANPKNEKDLVLTNESSGVGIKFDHIDNPLTEAHKIKKVSNILVRNHLYTNTVNFLNKASNKFLPFFFSRQVNINSAKHFDFVVSNVPGSHEKLKIGGLFLEEIYCFPNPGPHSCFIGIFTYLNKTQITMVRNSNVDCDEKEFMKYLEKEIDTTLEAIHTK